MEILRRAHRLTCLLLAWFALSVGVAIASPVINPQAMELICSGSGSTKVLVAGEGDAWDGASHMHDCRLCVMTGAPPVPVVFAPHQPPAQPLAPILPVPVAAQTAAPLSARAPPVL
jgi:hypothetical protein